MYDRGDSSEVDESDHDSDEYESNIYLLTLRGKRSLRQGDDSNDVILVSNDVDEEDADKRPPTTRPGRAITTSEFDSSFFDLRKTVFYKFDINIKIFKRIDVKNTRCTFLEEGEVIQNILPL